MTRGLRMAIYFVFICGAISLFLFISTVQLPVPFDYQSSEAIPTIAATAYPPVTAPATNATTKVITIVSWMGIEGSGHHLFRSILTHIATANATNASSVRIVYAVEGGPGKYMFLHGTWWPDCCETLDAQDMIQLLNFTDHFYSQPGNLNKRLIFVTSPTASYPCGNDGKEPYYPSVVDIVENVNSNTALNVYIELRLIVMKRHWVKAITSSCIHRFGACKKRSRENYHGAMSIDQQLKSIPQRYWIVIDYFLLIQNNIKYATILSEWLNIKNITLMQHGLSVIHPHKANTSFTQSLQSAWHDIERWDNGEYIEPVQHFDWAHYVKEDKNFSLKSYMLSMFSSTNLNHTVWTSDCVLVTPEYSTFLDPNYNCNY